MSDPVRAIEDAHAKATPGEWGAYFTAHGDPFIVTDPARPGFTRLASVDVGATDYGRANTEFIAISHNAWPAVSAHIAALTAENARLNEAASKVMDEMVQVGASGDEDACCDGVGLSHKMLMDWYLTLKRATRESALLARSQREGKA